MVGSASRGRRPSTCWHLATTEMDWMKVSRGNYYNVVRKLYKKDIIEQASE